MNTTGKKFGGRKKGTPNKVTQETRELFSELLHENIDTIREDLKEVEPYQRIKILLELSKFVIPTLKAVEHSPDEDDEKVSVIINIDEAREIARKLEDEI